MQCPTQQADNESVSKELTQDSNEPEQMQSDQASQSEPDGSESNPKSKSSDEEDAQDSIINNSKLYSRIDVEDSEVRDINGIAIYLDKLFYGSRAGGEKLKPSLYLLPAENVSLPEFIRRDSDAHQNMLKQKHMLVIGCASQQLAISIAQTLITELEITDPKQRRGYTIKEKYEGDIDIDVEFFLPEKNSDKKVAVVVTALGNSGQPLVNSLVNDPLASGRLRDNAFYLIFVVNPVFIHEWASEQAGIPHFPYWKISYLRYLLWSQFHERYLDYERQIYQQQERGWWNKDESKLCYEVESYIEQGNLLAEIKRRTGTRKPPSAESVFKDEQFIEKVVAYVATYFPDVTPSEFCVLVEALLGDRKVLASIPKITYSDGQKIEWSRSPSVRPIIEVWKDHQDLFVREHLRETVSSNDLVKIIDFENSLMRDSLRQYLDNNRKLFLKDQFNVLLSKGYLFYPSSKITANMVKLTAKTAVDYPDEYNKDWLVGIIRDLRERFQSNSNNSDVRESPFFQFLEKVPFNKVSWGYWRVSELIRELIKTPETRDLVHRSLSDLMRPDLYDAVLNVVKRLRFSEDFDQFYWIKQLFDRGDSNIKSQAFDYLYDNIRKGNIGIYEVLGKLESWLPPAGRESYPQSTRFALRLLIRYCLETAIRFNPKHAGEWPTGYPLFVFTDKAAADSSLDRLVRWLLHPAMKETPRDLESDPGMKKMLNFLRVEKNPTHLLGMLMAEWAFILLGPVKEMSDGPGADEGAGDEVTLDLSAAELLEMLLDKVASNASEEQQRDLVASWELISRSLMHSMSSTKHPIEDGDRQAQKWDRIFHLTQAFGKTILKVNSQPKS